MNDRNRTTTLRLRTPTAAPSVGSAPPRTFVGAGQRAGLEGRRTPLQTYIPRRADPTSQAIMEELAALGLADSEERD
jgi:hypothetical protein